MITANDKLKIQAYVDGELSRAEARKVESLISSDNEARCLYEELKATSVLLKQNEPEVKLTVPRELYWQQIYSKIQQADNQPVSVLEHLYNLVHFALAKKYFVPVTAAIVLLIGFFTLKEIARPTEDYLVVIENVAEEVGSYSFRASSEKMFVVWIYNKEIPDTKPRKEELDDLMLEEGAIYQ